METELTDIGIGEMAAMLEERMEAEEAATTAPEQAPAEADESESDDSSEEAQADEQADEEDKDEETADEEDEGSDENQKSQLYTVKVQGKEEQVTLDELLNGYSREADYRRKTQEHAAQRKAFDAEREAFEADRQATAQERQRYLQVLSRADEALKDDSELEVDMAKFEAGDEKEKDKYVRRARALEKKSVIAQEQARVQQQQERDLAQARAKAHQAVHAALTDPEKGLPGWADESKMNADIEKMEAIAAEYGFKPEALQQLSMIEGFVRMAHDSMVLKQIRSANPPTEKKPPARPPLRAGAAESKPSSTARKTQAASKRFSESGSAEDYAALLESRS